MSEMRVDAIARRMATQWWGTVQSQHKLADGIWMFSTAGHGGIIVDINVCPALAEHRSDVFCGRNESQLVLSEQHFAAFEEDCDAAMVEWAYPRIQNQLARIAKVEPRKRMEWVYNRKQLLARSLQRWHSDWFDAHPFACGESEPELYDVDVIYSRNMGSKGYTPSRWKGRPCPMEGCTGHRIQVRWDDGSLTFPCTKSLERVREGAYKIC